MLYHRIRSSLSSLACQLGIHRWAAHIYRFPAVGASYRVRSCSSCHARRVSLLAGGAA